MENDVDGKQIAVRLLLTVVAAAVIGLERETNGRAAGLRTTLLVGLAACVAMIQANLLLTVRGKAPDSYAVMDLMRLPLGILSGMGFIGAGAILRRDDRVLGVTTAATMWFVTVLGLCFGGGQIGLGLGASVLGLVVLRGLKWSEHRWLHTQRAILSLVAGPAGPTEQELADLFALRGCTVGNWSISYSKQDANRRLTCHVHWRGDDPAGQLPSFLKNLAQRDGVLELEWNRAGKQC